MLCRGASFTFPLGLLGRGGRGAGRRGNSPWDGRAALLSCTAALFPSPETKRVTHLTGAGPSMKQLGLRPSRLSRNSIASLLRSSQSRVPAGPLPKLGLPDTAPGLYVLQLSRWDTLLVCELQRDTPGTSS